MPFPGAGFPGSQVYQRPRYRSILPVPAKPRTNIYQIICNTWIQYCRVHWYQLMFSLYLFYHILFHMMWVKYLFFSALKRVYFFFFSKQILGTAEFRLSKREGTIMLLFLTRVLHLKWHMTHVPSPKLALKLFF